MQIAGLVKNSFVDYPGLIAAVAFVPPQYGLLVLP